jgi:hypothetical protein
MKPPAYFDSQVSAAAALGIDIYKIRQVKAAGCLAFRSGRVYRDDLLAWFEEKRRLRAAKSNRDPRIDRTMPVAKMIIALTDCVNLGLITDDQYFEIGTAIVRSITDEIKDWSEGKPLIDEWAENLLRYLVGKFKDLEAAHKAHPKLVGWICRVAGVGGVEYGGKKYPAN